MPPDARFRQVFDRGERYVEDRYGIPVVITDVPNPFTGDLDGRSIAVDFENTPQEALFVLIHLFGHTVQWNLVPRYREIGYKLVKDPSEALLEELHSYEKEACRYSIGLLRELDVSDLDQWVSDYSACDLAYLFHFYRTGEKRDFFSFWQDGQPCMEPLEIPDFRPEQWVSRWEGIVI